MKVRVGNLGTVSRLRGRNAVIAAALAVGALLLVTLYVQKSNDSGTAANQTAGVFVARNDIPVGTPGASLGNRIKLDEVQSTSVVPGAISDRAQVNDLVTSQVIYAGEQVTARRFQTLGAEGIRGQIKRTYRAMQIPGDADQLLAGTLVPEDRIDVIANIHFNSGDFKGSPGNGVSRLATRIVLRNIRVLATSGVTGGSGLSNGNANSGSWVMLALTDIQAQKMFFVMKNADWWLQLRPAAAAADSSPSVETAGSVIGDGLGKTAFEQLVSGAKSP